MTHTRRPADTVGQTSFPCPARRRVLAGMGGAAVAAVLAACSSGGEESSPSGGNASDNAGGAGGDVLAATSDVPVGGGVVAGGVVVAQPSDGTFRAYEAACPHQGVLVGPPEDGVITCPAHRSTFSDADGSLIGGPAPQGLTEVPVRVSGGNVVRA